MANVPQAPQTPWTEIAPTGSSIAIRSKNRIEKTTRMPAANPVTIAQVGAITSHPAVIATRPARAPLRDMEISGFFTRHQEVTIAPMAPAAAARLVTTAITASDPPSMAVVLPGLNPNHPSHKIKTPSVAMAILCPRIGCATPFLYLPIRAPSTMAPARAAQPPTE